MDRDVVSTVRPVAIAVCPIPCSFCIVAYSTYSSACIVNKAYADPANFDQVSDIFSTQLLTTARSVVDRPFPGFLRLPPDRPIEECFDHIDRNPYGDFNAQYINESFHMINSTLNNDNSTGSGYMFATLRAYNSTDVNRLPGTTQTTMAGMRVINQRERRRV